MNFFNNCCERGNYTKKAFCKENKKRSGCATFLYQLRNTYGEQWMGQIHHILAW